MAVADHGSFSRAAAAVHRSQSRVSAHVATLERVLGTVLFDRRHRPIELTDAGEALLPHARKVLASLDAAVSAVDSLSGVQRGRVVVGAHPSISAGFLPWVLREVATRQPQIRVELSEATTVGLAEGLGNGSIHLALRSVSATPTTDDLTFDTLWREPYVAVVPEGHPLTVRPAPLPPTALLEHPLILIARPGSSVDPDTFAVLRRWGVPDVSATWQTEQPQTLANLTKAGLGVGVINAFAMQVSETTGLRIIEVGSNEDGRVDGLTYDPERYMSSATRAVRQAILDAPRPEGAYPP